MNLYMYDSFLVAYQVSIIVIMIIIYHNTNHLYLLGIFQPKLVGGFNPSEKY